LDNDVLHLYATKIPASLGLNPDELLPFNGQLLPAILHFKSGIKPNPVMPKKLLNITKDSFILSNFSGNTDLHETTVLIFST